MSEIIFKANINECKVENWQSNTGEVNVRELKVEMTEELSNCDNQFVTFELADGTKHESKVTDGKADIPIFDKPQFIKIGLYAENGEGEKRYSSRPANVYVSTGSFPDGAEEPPIPTAGTYAELLEMIKNSGGGITEITEDTFVYDLAPGIYKINAADDSYCIYMDDCYWLCLYEGIVSFSYSEYENMYSWFYVGRDMSNGSTALFGRTHWNGEYWVCDDYRDVYSQLETNNNRVNDFKKVSYSNYPSTKAVVNYVAEQLANVGGGSNIDLVTEFEGTDVDYKKNEVYHANIVNGLIAQLVELIENKQDLLQDGENIKTINGQSILGEGDLSVGGGSGEEWEPILAVVNATLVNLCGFEGASVAGNNIPYVIIPTADTSAIKFNLGANYKKLLVCIVNGDASDVACTNGSIRLSWGAGDGNGQNLREIDGTKAWTNLMWDVDFRKGAINFYYGASRIQYVRTYSKNNFSYTDSLNLTTTTSGATFNNLKIEIWGVRA